MNKTCEYGYGSTAKWSGGIGGQTITACGLPAINIEGDAPGVCIRHCTSERIAMRELTKVYASLSRATAILELDGEQGWYRALLCLRDATP